MLLTADPAWRVTFLDHNETETHLTRDELIRRASSVAGALTARGIRPGDRVALILGTGPEYVVALFGALFAGAAVASLPPRVRLGRAEEYHRATVQMLRTMEARLVITHANARRLLGGVIEDARPELGCAAVAELEGPPRPPHSWRGEDLAIIQFSSGSTTTPKGVTLTHDNIVAHAAAVADRLEFEGQRFVSWLPLHHDMGLLGMVLGSLSAASLVLLPPELFIARPAAWLRAMARYRGTLSTAPNFAYALCLRKVTDAEMEGLDLSAWRHALSGAEHVSPDVVRRFCERFSRWGFREDVLIPVYGLAEATLGVSFSPHRQVKTRAIDASRAMWSGEVTSGTRELASVGVPIPGVEVEIRDEERRALPAERVGRIFVRGRSITRGYINDPDATAATLIDGWLDTGDLGFIGDGELFIVGRAKEVVVIRGANRAPQEFEDCLDGIPGLRPGCRVAVGFWPEGAEQEELLLLAERRTGAERVPDAALIERIRMAVTHRTGIRPHTVVLLEPGTLPRTTSGKWRRGEALKRHLSGTLQPPQRPGRLKIVADLVRSQLAYARLWFGP
jgi:acyl-CoA synthetase (AMP-forming)/AMP-acid ligase II